MEFSIGDRVVYAGGDSGTLAQPGQVGTVIVMSEQDKDWFGDSTYVDFGSEYPYSQFIETDCLALA